MGNSYIDIARKAAQEAGEIILSFSGKTTVSYKTGHFDSVTDADVASGRKIKEILTEAFPSFSYYGEEEGYDIKGSEFMWVVDSLDGTVNFIHNIPIFGISVALLRKGQPEVGILYFPKTGLLVEAESGTGAFANGRKIQVSRKTIEKSLYYQHGKFRGKIDFNFSLIDTCGLVKMVDTSSFELAQIAMGDAELYVLENVLHDVAAGVCIVREAGGKVTDYKGNPWTPESEGIVVSNGVIHGKVIDLLK